MAGLLDQYFDPETLAAAQQLGQPSEEQRRQARNNALMSAGFSMMMNNGGMSRNQALFNAIGHGGMAGVGAYGQGIEDARQQNMSQFQQAIGLKKLQEEMRQRQAQQGFINSNPNIPEEVKAGVVPFAEWWKRQNPEDQYKTVGDSLVRITTKGAESVFQNKKAPEGFQYDESGQLQVMPGWLQAQKDIRAAGRAVSNTNVFNNTKDDFKNERDLRNDFAGLPTTKAFNEVQSAYDQINVAIQKQSPAGDLAAATKIMKILDPGSVVRESELGMAMQATGAMDRITNYADMVMKGTKLTPSQRKDFGELAAQLYGAAYTRYNASVDEYQGVARDYKLNPDRVAKRAAGIQQQPAHPQIMQLPKNPTAKDLQRGMVYSTPKGNLRWNGMQFEDAQ